LKWSKVGGRYFRGIRPFLYAEDQQYYLLYELHQPLWRSGIVARRSVDLVNWDEPRMLLPASEKWDGGMIRFLGNPCLVKAGEEYRLYFSCGWIWLWDCLYFEPKYIGMATSSALLGSYRRHPELLMGPETHHPYRNFGAGSVKVLADGTEGWWVFNNGIYHDREGKSRSAIMLLHSADGVALDQGAGEPIVAPEPGWKKAFVYAFDVVSYGGEIRLYYNARDGWFRGSERVGLATAAW